MAAQRKHPRSKHDASADQLTLADWEGDQVRDSQRSLEASTLELAPTPTPLEGIAPLAAAPAPRIAAELAARSGASQIDDGATARLLTLDQLVAELPPAKRPQTWKRWLYERTRRGEIPSCVKLGGMLFFERDPALTWLRAGATSGPK
jgi:hypothetical protein